ncbi:MAG TPA: hypothetical protein VNO21_09040 [Polyangiaceae bacterium]|nr:hypothetical protein [Polyangiaceae bacterium]
MRRDNAGKITSIVYCDPESMADDASVVATKDGLVVSFELTIRTTLELHQAQDRVVNAWDDLKSVWPRRETFAEGTSPAGLKVVASADGLTLRGDGLHLRTEKDVRGFVQSLSRGWHKVVRLREAESAHASHTRGEG